MCCLYWFTVVLSQCLIPLHLPCCCLFPVLLPHRFMPLLLLLLFLLSLLSYHLIPYPLHHLNLCSFSKRLFYILTTFLSSSLTFFLFSTLTTLAYALPMPTPSPPLFPLTSLFFPPPAPLSPFPLPPHRPLSTFSFLSSPLTISFSSTSSFLLPHHPFPPSLSSSPPSLSSPVPPPHVFPAP